MRCGSKAHEGGPSGYQRHEYMISSAYLQHKPDWWMRERLRVMPPGTVCGAQMTVTGCARHAAALSVLAACPERNWLWYSGNPRVLAGRLLPCGLPGANISMWGADMGEVEWERARLFPVSGIGGANEQERRAASALLAVVQSVWEFGRQRHASRHLRDRASPGIRLFPVTPGPTRPRPQAHASTDRTRYRPAADGAVSPRRTDRRVGACEPRTK